MRRPDEAPRSPVARRVRVPRRGTHTTREQGAGHRMSMHVSQRRATTLPNGTSAGQFGTVLTRNINTLVELRKEADRNKSSQDRIADRITGFTGSMTFVYLHAALFGGWIVVNLGLLPIPPFDPTFVTLAMVASVEAIFLSTFVLISQNRMMAASDKRAELDLQISLLAEHEVTQAIKLLDAIAERLGVQADQDEELEEAKQDVDPAMVFQAIDEQEQKNGSDGSAA